ncbi:MAG: hypothetical protein Q4P07_13170, partial [Ornithinimicrobium sp.]|uniref:hypothetical protein n=1 Tax=Ornithinimicrobium sp. TaxID=1977084 RepID=UPI0026E0AD5F
MTTFTIDCDSCPARGRLCGDCFVPVLGKIWLETPTARTMPSLGSGRSDPPEAGHDHAVLEQ